MKLTANMVTMARIFLLPFPMLIFLHGDLPAKWMAFFIFVFLGTTDFIDGYMARRDGPTKLGTLIDPVADKMFVVAVLLAMSASNMFPVWASVAIVARELLVTSLRTSVAERSGSIKTSHLAKMKTIFQMGGLGSLFLSFFLPHWAVAATLVFLILVLIGFWIFFYKSQVQLWLPCSIAGWALIAVSVFYMNLEQLSLLYAVGLVFVTWLSAIDYLVGSFKVFKRVPVGQRDLARLLWSLAFSIGIVSWIGHYPQLILPLLITLSFELATGGVDNMVASPAKRFSSIPFWLTGSSAAVAGLTVWADYHGVIAINAYLAMFLLALVSFATFSAVFYQWRHIFRRAF